jgi:glucokinase
MILAADIGGTKSSFALFKLARGALKEVTSQTFASREHKNLDQILSQFLAAQRARVTRACFGVAGPVKNGRAAATNLPWVVDSVALARKLGVRAVGLINDLEATAWGLSELRGKDLLVINEGSPTSDGNAAVIAAGTGLGEAGVQWNGKERCPFASEGGHADFAPRQEIEIELLRHLKAQFGRVSYERILSGPGLYNVYRFFRDTGRGEESDWLKQELAQGDPSAVISRAALEGKSPLCEQALDLFVDVYGAEAGNMALKMMATAGVYIGGGIAPKIVQKLKQKRFFESFASKGRLRSLLEGVPIRVIMNDKAALLGAARWILRRGAANDRGRRTIRRRARR